uniref:ATP synthase subunit 8 n=1 Tax=Vampyroteuthis infernalis TaxID=55288 RepID=A7BG37_9MOLL|nr:ATP synthase F0 subunit 8 [Vampyroteuthis infernalis]BAF73640.1 ATP synthase subunit 8 [Vampyroteuthis infernalis]
MPQLSPINWIFLFSFFWFMMSITSSIMWWNPLNMYKMNMNNNYKILIKYNW